MTNQIKNLNETHEQAACYRIVLEFLLKMKGLEIFCKSREFKVTFKGVISVCRTFWSLYETLLNKRYYNIWSIKMAVTSVILFCNEQMYIYTHAISKTNDHLWRPILAGQKRQKRTNGWSHRPTLTRSVMKMFFGLILKSGDVRTYDRVWVVLVDQQLF